MEAMARDDAQPERTPRRLRSRINGFPGHTAAGLVLLRFLRRVSKAGCPSRGLQPDRQIWSRPRYSDRKALKKPTAIPPILDRGGTEAWAPQSSAREVRRLARIAVSRLSRSRRDRRRGLLGARTRAYPRALVRVPRRFVPRAARSSRRSRSGGGRVHNARVM